MIRIGSSLSFVDYYYQFIVVIFLNFVHQDFQREREEKEERERAREIHRVRYEFGRIVYSMFIIIIISSSSIIPWFVKNSFFFLFHRCGRTTRMKK